MNKFKFEKAVKEVLNGVISFGYGKEGETEVAYVSTKNILVRYSNLHRLYTVLAINGFEMVDAIVSGRPAQNNEFTYEIYFTIK